MKVEMRENKHLWVTFGYCEIVVDRELKDIRIKIGTDIIKIRYNDGLKDILLNDIPLQKV